MARIHTDIHVVSIDDYSRFFELLRSNDLIKYSHSDVRCSQIPSVKNQYPDECIFIDVKSIY